MTDRPPTALPAGFSREPATGAHEAEVFEVVAAELTAAFGFCPATPEDVRADLVPPATAHCVGYVVRDPSGAVVQWWGTFRSHGVPFVLAWIRSHPRLPDPVSDTLAEAGWATLVAWSRRNPPEGEGGFELRSGCPAGAGAGSRHLANAGFTHRRTYWEMLGPVTEGSRTSPPVPGLTITAGEDSRTLHRVLSTAFTGEWGYTRLEFDDWVADQRSMSGFDPTLWFLARLDGSPAAAMLLSRRLESAGALYVQELATLASLRRRGIATALLAHAFDLAATSGLGQVSLHVDSENPHDAPSLYRTAGFDVRSAFHMYTVDLMR